MPNPSLPAYRRQKPELSALYAVSDTRDPEEHALPGNLQSAVVFASGWQTIPVYSFYVTLCQIAEKDNPTLLLTADQERVLNRSQ